MESPAAANEQARQVAMACNQVLLFGGPEEWGAMRAGGHVGMEVKVERDHGIVFLFNEAAHRLLRNANPPGKLIPPWAYKELEKSVARGEEPQAAFARIATRLQAEPSGWIWGVMPVMAGGRLWLVAKIGVVPSRAGILHGAPPTLDEGAVRYLAGMIANAPRA